MDYKYVSLDRILAKVTRDIGGDFNEGDVIEWAGEALEFIGAIKYYEEAIAFSEVKNFQCAVPPRLHSIIQIGKDNQWTGPTNDCCPQKIIESCIGSSFVQITEGNTCDIKSMKSVVPDYIILDCNGMPLNDFDIAYYRPYFDLKAEAFGAIGGSSFFKQRYTTIRLSTSTLFDGLVCQTNNDNSSNRCCSKDEYTVIKGSTIRFSFQSGFVAIPYTRQVVDEQGWPMIHDNISYTTAITKYIALKLAEKDFDKGREGSAQRVKKYEDDWQWYCSQASSVDKMPYGIDEHQNLLDQRSYLLPRNNRYYSFFGNLNTPENRFWNRGSRINGVL